MLLLWIDKTNMALNIDSTSKYVTRHSSINNDNEYGKVKSFLFH